ncbi:hypothetical protein WMF04_04375 [Sorangium sp. So ce260]|uniref:hypothetical protein n=1 Tax=Sorangium sp. So ce260 TaxID=3133291 RepID=UPI003F5FFFF8
MPTRRKSHRDDLPPSRRRPSLSGVGEWERMMVRKLGLDDIPWDPERCCEHCIAKRAARGEAVEELVPPSRSRAKPLLGLGWARSSSSADDSKGRSKRGGKLTLLKLVRSPRDEGKDS